MNTMEPETSGEVRRIRRLVAFLGVFFILLGQFLIYSAPLDEKVLFPQYEGLSLLGVALFLLSQLVRPGPLTRRLAGRILISERAAWVVAAFMLSVLATVGSGLFQISTRSNYIPVLAVWVLAGLAYVDRKSTRLNSSHRL